MGPRCRRSRPRENRRSPWRREPEAIGELARLVDAQIVLWGELSGEQLTMKLMDLRTSELPAQIARPVTRPTDLRFAVEEVLQQIEGVASFEHPSSNWSGRTITRRSYGRSNANLVSNGDFEKNGAWTGVYRAELVRAERFAIDAGGGQGGDRGGCRGRQCTGAEPLAGVCRDEWPGRPFRCL